MVTEVVPESLENDRTIDLSPDLARRDLVTRADALNVGQPGPADVAGFLQALEGAIDPRSPGQFTHLVRAGPRPGDGAVYPQTDFRRLELRAAGAALLLGRTLLPGHPVVDERRFEVAFLDYRKPRIPAWFPRAGRFDRVFIARVRWASDGFRHPFVFGLFSDLFEGKPAWSGEGGVALLFVSRVSRLFERTLQCARILGIDASGISADDRATALMAHEWGHAASGYGPTAGHRAANDRTWSASVQHEWDADAAAMEMLVTAPGPGARRALQALVLDKLLRLAWYPERNDRADAAASRRFVAWCLARGVLRTEAKPGYTVAWPALERLLKEGQVREMAVDSADETLIAAFRSAWKASSAS